METRIQQVLDGELLRSQLSEAEQAALADVETAIRGVLRAIPVGPVPSLAPAVLRRIDETPHRASFAGRIHDALAWIWKPRAISWRPAYAVPALAAVALFLWLNRSEPLPPPAAQAHVLVEFRLNAPQANRVSLAGDFTNWKPTYTLVRGEPGVWTIVVPLAPGVHDYAFIIDGERWLPDPMAPAVADGFGGLNSRVAVLPPDVES